MHPIYDLVLQMLRTDISQMIEEGHDEKALLSELDEVQSAGSLDSLFAFQEELWHRPSPPLFPYDEPDDWESIASAFPDAQSHARFQGTEDDLADKILAAWQGRCVGCQLGKPLEGTWWPEKMKELLQFVGSWPLTDYMNPVPDEADTQNLPDIGMFRSSMRNTWTRGRFDAVLPDDDIHYTITSQQVLEKYGPDFTTEQSINEVIHSTPFSAVFAAGRNMFKNRVFGFEPPYTAMLGNPCRQSLGAMIRCDPFGWGAPANPALAAKMAYKDAVGSQTRNGIYSGMFFAALMADTLAHGDPVRAIDTAAAYVPPKSRFADMIRFVKDLCAAEDDWERVNAAIYERYPEEAKMFNHSIPNAAIVLLGLLMGKGDFTKTVGITVMAGMDTDCNGATAGSIMGCALGTKGIPFYWIDPLNDTIRTLLSDMHESKITGIAHRMYKFAAQHARYGISS